MARSGRLRDTTTNSQIEFIDQTWYQAFLNNYFWHVF